MRDDIHGKCTNCTHYGTEKCWNATDWRICERGISNMRQRKKWHQNKLKRCNKNEKAIKNLQDM